MILVQGKVQMLDSTLCQMGTMTSNMSPSHKSTNLFQSCMKDIKKME